MFFLYGCACLSFSDPLAYGYAVMMLNVLRSDITIKNSTVSEHKVQTLGLNEAQLAYMEQ